MSALTLARHWRPALWEEVPQPLEPDPRRILRPWPPGTHGEHDPGFALQDRDLDILSRLWAAGALLSTHIQALFFPGVTQPSAVQRRLRMLYAVGLLRRHRPQLPRGMGSSPLLFSLSRLGFEVLSVAQPHWWAARWPGARWDRRRHEREPGPELLHPLLVAEVASWAVSRLGREWIFESEPAGVVSAGVMAAGSRPREVLFHPDAILTDPARRSPDWFLELEWRAYLPSWREKIERWDRWRRKHALTETPAQILVAGYLRDSPNRYQWTILPLLRALPPELATVVQVRDLERWDAGSDEAQAVSASRLLRSSA
jgi:hypothetical protein